MFLRSASYPFKFHSLNTIKHNRVSTLFWHSFHQSFSRWCWRKKWYKDCFGCVHSACEFRTFLSVCLFSFVKLCFCRLHSIHLMVSASALPLFFTWTFLRFWNLLLLNSSDFFFFLYVFALHTFLVVLYWICSIYRSVRWSWFNV